MAVTIYDVAAKAGVSFQLAAAVLGNKKYARASEATRKRIREAARELDYRSSMAATVLAGGNSKLIGVIIDSRAPESMYRLLAEIEQAADREGYRILTAQSHDNPEKLLDSYHSLKQNGVAATVSLAHDYSPINCHLDEVLKDDPRIVFVLEAPEGRCSSVDVDIAGAMRSAVGHLRDQGYRKIALLLNKQDKATPLARAGEQRIEGFAKACPGGQILYTSAPPVNFSSIPQDIVCIKSSCRKLIRDVLIPQGFDAVIAQNDIFAAALMSQLLAEGIRVPRNFGIIGWDNLLYDELFPVPLTSVAPDVKEIAASVLKILMDKIAGKTDPVQIEIPLKLMVRESSMKDNKNF